jgi:hypothetical protein
VLQSVLPTLNIAATVIQAAWRRFKARAALPYLRARSVAIKLSRKYGVSTVVLHAAANRIRKGWRVGAASFTGFRCFARCLIGAFGLCG